MVRIAIALFGFAALVYAGWRLLPDHALEMVNGWIGVDSGAEVDPSEENSKEHEGFRLFRRDTAPEEELEPIPPTPAPLTEIDVWRQLPKVILDPGHGGVDPGNVAADRFEKELVLDIALRVARCLREHSIPVEMTRIEDVTIRLDARVAATFYHPDSILVSIHLNAHDEKAYNGIETFWYSGQAAEMPEPQRALLRQRSHRLAQLVHENLIRALDDVDDREVKEKNLKMIREPRVPAALVECGFLSNPEEGGKLMSVTYREQVAAGIADGIAAAWEEKLMIAPDVEPIEIVTKELVSVEDSEEEGSGSDEDELRH